MSHPINHWASQGITYAGVFGVLLINVIMRNVLKSLVEFERPRTKTGLSP